MPKKASWRQIRASNLYGTVKESPEVEIANLKSLLDDSEKRVEFVENQVSNLRQKLREKEEEVEDLTRKLNSKTEEFTCFRSISHAAIEEARRCQKIKDEKILEEKIEGLKMEIRGLVESSPSRGSTLKPYDLLTSKKSRKDRCERVVEAIEGLVGAKNLDRFLTDFVHFIAASEKFSFALALSPWDSFFCTIRWKLSNKFIKEFKDYLNSKLGFDVFSSRQEIDKIRKNHAPLDDYNINIETTTRCTRKGFEAKVPMAVVSAKNVKNLVERRFQSLQNNSRLQFEYDDEVALGFGGDKGADVTKLCIVFQNIASPNNPHGILLVGYYTGDDNYANLKSKMRTVFEQVNNIKSIKYIVDGVEVEKNVKILPIGDCKIISAMFNHAGQSSLSPCFRCKATWSTHGINKAVIGSFPFENAGPIRSLNDLTSDGDPLLLVEPENAAPPGVHTILGVCQAYVVDWLIATANRDDFGEQDLPQDLKKQNALYKNVKKEEKQSETAVTALKIPMLLFCRPNPSSQKFWLGKEEGSGTNPPCSASLCIAHHGKKSNFKDQEVFHCVQCNKSVHGVCAMLFTVDEHSDISNYSAKCIDCRIAPGMSLIQLQQHLEQRKQELKEKIVEDESLLEDIQEERNELQDLLKNSSGATRQALENVLVNIGCDYRVWFQELNGNQARTLLRIENIDKIVAVFPKSNELCIMANVMKDLAFIMSQADNSTKTDEEIDKIQAVLDRFCDNLRKVQPSSGVLPKLHLLTAHLVPFLRDHRSWGKVTEQGIEALHPIFNSLNLRFAAVRDPLLRASLTVQMMTNFNVIHDVGESWNISK
uniref:Zinc finger PHD-type domain-containing protein n=1 Tax=Caenorhabditis japonica TaxID=281687 RepID=A0A8R1I823_CAEJA